jgi:transketolase
MALAMTLEEQAREARRLALAAIFAAGSGHPGGSLSCVELLVWLFDREIDPARLAAGDPDRDRVVLSKGHAAPALYAVAALHGLLPRAALFGLRRLDSALQGHPDVRHTPWVETCTGSLGQGFSAALGMALGLRHRRSAARVFAILGDGELQEGQVWEAAAVAAHQGLDRLVALVDYNKLQSDDRNANICELEPLVDRWRAFNWNAFPIDGHDFGSIRRALERAGRTRGRPTVVIAHTVKGRGVSFMEDDPPWHGSVKLRPEELDRALADLGVAPAELGRYVHAGAC